MLRLQLCQNGPMKLTLFTCLLSLTVQWYTHAFVIHFSKKELSQSLFKWDKFLIFSMLAGSGHSAHSKFLNSKVLCLLSQTFFNSSIIELRPVSICLTLNICSISFPINYGLKVIFYAQTAALNMIMKFLCWKN